MEFTYEKQFFHVEQAIAAANGVSISGDLGLDFNEPEYPMTIQDQIQLDEFELKHNLTTEAGLMVKYNKDLTISEAQQIIDNNKDLNGQGQQQQQSPIFSQLRQQTPTS